MRGLRKSTVDIEDSIRTFVTICDEAEALISDREVDPTSTGDLSPVLDLFITPSFDKNRVDQMSFKHLEEAVRGCSLCRLAETRTKTVFGTGVPSPTLMVIGEGPGGDEDLQGEAFVGRAGKYLDAWLNAINLSRTNGVYITNIVKCRPPNNRDPQGDEVEACVPYLSRQIQLLQPQAILLLGRVAAQTLLGRKDALAALRGTFHRYEGIPVLVTYHPAAVLRDQRLKRPVWEDLKKIASFLNIALPGRS
ncbi:MAG: uracil-DNA glycosylase [Spirochaetales bacterium]|nr:uracil-DNA glycosylase [Spirochaetales bacterium]